VSATTLVRTAAAFARERQLTVDAAGVAFYAFNFLVALAVLVYTALSLVGTGNFLVVTAEALTGVETAALRRLFEEVGGDATGRRRAVALALAISLWSSFRLFGAVESVFAEVYRTRQDRSLARRLLDSLLVLLAVTLTVTVMAAAASLFLFRTGIRAWVVAGPLVVWVALVVLFFPVYYQFSGHDASLGEVLPGAAVAAAGWTLSALALRVYVGVSESVDLYGVVGAVFLVLTWLYVVALSLLVGVVLNATLAGRLDDGSGADVE
jgi:membrane protein